MPMWVRITGLITFGGLFLALAIVGKLPNAGGNSAMILGINWVNFGLFVQKLPGFPSRSQQLIHRLYQICTLTSLLAFDHAFFLKQSISPPYLIAIGLCPLCAALVYGLSKRGAA